MSSVCQVNDCDCSFSSLKKTKSSHHSKRVSKSVDKGYSDSSASSGFKEDLKSLESTNVSTNNQFIVLYDYTARVEDDLSIKKGQLVTVLDKRQGYWWLAECPSSQKTGYVPFNYLASVLSLESHEWYFGGITRSESESLLRRPENTQSGTFLVRKSETNPGEYSLSISYKSLVKHYRIQNKLSSRKLSADSVNAYYISKQFTFPNLQLLVLHYSESSCGLCSRLKFPCQRKTNPTPVGLAHNLIDKWEIPKTSIKLGALIGKGHFSEVYQAIWNGTTPVAVKTLKPNTAHINEFQREAQTMKQLHHPNLLQLYAVCTQSEPWYLVTELMPKGSLLSYLQSEEGHLLKEPNLLLYAAQIASAMAYLESKRFIHRDLAARNVLVANVDQVKIADFGLARMLHSNNKEYIAKMGARFPIKWTAPEAAHQFRFTIKSDVWSFGVLLSEIITHGNPPYPQIHNSQILKQLTNGYRMSKPKNCPQKWYELMLACWSENPDDRPSFDLIHRIILERLNALTNTTGTLVSNGGNCGTLEATSSIRENPHSLHENKIKIKNSDIIIETKEHHI